LLESIIAQSKAAKGFSCARIAGGEVTEGKKDKSEKGMKGGLSSGRGDRIGGKGSWDRMREGRVELTRAGLRISADFRAFKQALTEGGNVLAENQEQSSYKGIRVPSTIKFGCSLQISGVRTKGKPTATLGREKEKVLGKTLMGPFQGIHTGKGRKYHYPPHVGKR